MTSLWRNGSTVQSKDLLKLVVAALEERKAVDIRVLDVGAMTTLTDFMVMASGTSGRQLRALSDNVVIKAKERGIRPLGVEGEDTDEWVLVDLIDVIVHIMVPEIRDHYQLEKLWGGQDTEITMPKTQTTP